MRFRISAHAALSVLAGAAVVLNVASLAPPLLTAGFPAGHDTPAHVTYSYLFDAALSQGQFPVRWVEWIRPGHSQPLFSFYQPGFYYAVQLVHAVVPSLLLSMKLTILGAWWAAGALVYLNARSFGVWPAAAAAVLFLRGPYLILDVFVRAAFPEFAALALAPAVLWSLDGTLRSGRASAALAFAAATAAMLLCHLPTVLMFAPVLATYAICLSISRGCSLRVLGTAAAAAALAFGLACFYVVPALVELPFTKMRELTSGYFDYRQHFVEPWQWFRPAWGFGGSEAGAADNMSFQVGIVQWLAVAGCTAALAVRRRAAKSSVRWWIAYWLCIAGAALFMTSAASASVWQFVRPLAFVQFPWRFLSVVSLAVALMAAPALSLVGRSSVQAALVLCIAGGLWWQTQALLKPSHYLSRASVYIDNPGWRYTRDAARLAFIEPGYYPATVRKLPEGYEERWQITRGHGTTSARTILDHRLVLTVRSSDGVELTIKSHGFPGWRVLLDGRPTSWSYQHDSGYIVVDVPAGVHGVEAVFGNTAIRMWSNRISLLSALLWAGSAAAVGASSRTRRRVR